VPHQMASEKQNSLRFKQLEKQVRKVLSLPVSGNSTKSGKIVLREGPYQENSIGIPFCRSSTYAFSLASKGLTLATGDTADVYVGYQCSVDQEKQWNA
jgi:hypothetical protein